jgi:hypothetical protein
MEAEYKTLLSVVLCTVLACHSRAKSIDISHYDSGGNFLGLAVDPADHHIFLTGLGYSGGPKLWEFAPDGTLISSTIPIGLEPMDEITHIVVGTNGHLFASVNYPKKRTYDRKVVEMDRAGTTIYSWFTPPGVSTVGGYDAASGNLFLYEFPTQTVFATTARGSVLYSFNVALEGGTLYDIAYNPLTGTLFAAYMAPDWFILVEYRYHLRGRWSASRIIDLSSTGLFRTFSLAIDSSSDPLDPFSGLFYIQDMNGIVSFRLDDPTIISLPHAGGY